MASPDPGDGPGRRRKPREAGTRAILDGLLDGDREQTLDFNTLVSGLGRRAFGMLLFLLGLLLSLPIPFTNYVFGGIILLFALALLERDGVLMLVAWIVGVAALSTTGALSGGLIAAVQPWIERLS